MGTWTAANSPPLTPFPYELTGSGRTAFVTTATLPVPAALKFQFADPAHEVKVLVLCSEDGRSGYEIGTDGGTGGNILIRTVVNGVVGSAVTNDANDIPSSASCSTTHGLSTGTPYTLDIRIIDGDIEVRLNTSTGTPILKHTPTNAALKRLSAFGWASDQTGAVVGDAQVCQLTEQVSARAEVLVAVAGGDVWAGTALDALNRVATAVFPAGVTVDMDEFDGTMRMVGSGRARLFNPQTSAVTEWTENNHPDVKLPGADQPGTTGLSIVLNHRDRVYGSGLNSDPQNVFASAIGDAGDFDTGSDLPGKAFAIGGFRASRVGQPVVGMATSSNAALIIGCTSSIYQMTGEPALGQIETTPLSLDTGVSGKDAMWLCQDGKLLAHSPKGALVIYQGSPAVNITEGVLTQLIQIPPAEVGSYTVHVIRDAVRHGVHFFITPATGVGTHFWYDERFGAYTKNAGGFHPEQYPEVMQPVAVTHWQSRVLMGCKDGYLRWFDDTAKDDDGTFIASRMILRVSPPRETQNDRLFRWVKVTPSIGSDAFLAVVYGERTDEKALTSGTREALWSEVIDIGHQNPSPVNVRSGGLALELRSRTPDAGVAQSWSVEIVEAHVDDGRMATGAR